MKKLLKLLLPTALIKPLLPFWHWLQAVAANVRFGWPARGMNVIAITGTNGKTTTAALLGKILERNGWKVGISTTAFYQIGDRVEMNDTNMTVTSPGRLFGLMKQFKAAKVDWVILEVTSHALTQSRILGVPVKAAVMTNLTQDHLDYHGSMEAYAAAKARLFKKKPDHVVLNTDDDWFGYYAKYEGRLSSVTYGTQAKADVRIVKAKLGADGSKLDIKLERAAISPDIKLVGKFNAYNALAAAATAHALGLEPKIIEEGLESLDAVPGRMEMFTVNNYKFVVDYAHTADALKNVLESLRAVTRKKLIVVFGATGDRDKSKRPVMGKIAARLSDIAIVTDDDPYTENPIAIREAVLRGAQDVVDGAEVYEVADRRGAIAKAVELARPGDIILLAGIGHQKYRVIDGKKVEWSERAVAEELAAKAKNTKRRKA